MSYRDDAKALKAGKVNRLLGSGSNGTSESVMAAEGARGTPPAKGGTDNLPVRGKSSRSRMDRPCRARGGSVKKGKTNVTVIVAPQGSAQPAVATSGAVPMPPQGMPQAAPAVPPAGIPPRPPMSAPVPMRKSGGPVMKAGAGSGVGRLQKEGLA